MSGHRRRFSTASADEFPTGRSPWRRSPVPADVRQQRAKAVSTHYMVFVHAATGCCSVVRSRRRPIRVSERLAYVTNKPVADPAHARLPRALGYASRRSRRVPADSCGGVGTGVEPVTPRSIVWCSASELTSRHRHRHNPCPEHVDPNPTGWVEAPLVQTISRPCLEETPAGVEPAESCRPTLRVGAPGSRLTVWLQRLWKFEVGS